MLRVLSIILAGIITSFYFFPFVPAFLPMANTKMVMAVFGLVVLGFRLATNQRAEINKDFFKLSLFALGVSLAGIIAVILNETRDYTYASYIMSMWVWLGGAYFVVNCIGWVHGKASVRLVAHYLIGVCVAQCIIAYTMGQYAPLKNLVDSLVVSEGFMGKVEGRLYGIGAALDVAGMRFAAVMLIIGYLSVGFKHIIEPKLQWFYIISFGVIALIGNMIGRTTTVGAAISILFISFVTLKNRSENAQPFWRKLGLMLLISVPIIVYLYNTNPAMHNNIRFAFEGFFSLFEDGSWQTTSNDRLMNMYVWPDNLKTWIIGDGYFDNPFQTDPYYTGNIGGAFYMSTDVGYCRFLFYFGILGMLAFAYFIFYATKLCIRRFPNYKMMFVLILMLNYVVWLKVASDLFSVLALFLCVMQDDNEEYDVVK